MASPQPKPASRRLLNAAAAECVTLEADLQALEDRRRILQSELRSLELREREMRRRLRLVRDLAGDYKPRSLRAVPAGEATQPCQILRGAQIRQTAVQIVARAPDRLRPRHYTEWFQELVNAGFAITGRDPLAAFLTQLNRSPVVRRESEPGTYSLNYDVVQELERRLSELNEAFRQLHQGQQTIEAIATVREERERITSHIAQVERALLEAVACLHPE